jgi:hypothetical protein
MGVAPRGSARHGRRGGRVIHAPVPRPVVPVDGYGLGVRHARVGVAKLGSLAWGEHGWPAGEWFRYSQGYDGVVATARGGVR